MDRTTLERYLAQAEDYIDSGRLRVELQTGLVEQLKADGQEATNEEALLRRFEATLLSMEADRDFIHRLLRDVERPAG